MDDGAVWYLVAGAIFFAMALAGSALRPLPLTASIFYLAAGGALGPAGAGLLVLDVVRHSAVLERLTEAAVIVSLFTAGLKLRVPWRDPRWRLPVALASLSMAVTVGLVALAGVTLLALPLGAAVLLGAVLAPTDPVLASDVQVERPDDADRLRFALTGEAGFNDGSAFPFVMLGLGLLGLHELGADGLRWIGVDLVWAVAGGLGIGALLGTALGRLVVHLRATHRQAVGLDDFLALGLIALSYGAALLASAYGFLAVFAAGLALRRIERLAGGDAEEAAEDLDVGDEEEEAATHARKAPAYMAKALLGFNERLERIAEVALVVVTGALLPLRAFPVEMLWFVPLLFLVVRPLSVWLGTAGARASGLQRRLIAWFGIRGIGSFYYLMFAAQHGLEPGLAERLADYTLVVIAASILVHGISVTPLMRVYEHRQRARGAR